MYYLRGKENGKIYYILKNKEYSVGRKGTDIMLSNDASISRNHALIYVKDNEIVLKDVGAKYCTYLNDVKMEGHKEYILKADDTIKFGAYKSIFSICHVPLKVCCSSIPSSEKKMLMAQLEFLGGSLVQTWSADCNYLTVKEIVLTIKVLCAVTYGQPIVSLQFWKDFTDCVRSNKELPSIKDYLPTMSEMLLNQNVSLSFDENRKSLFKNKVFVFPDQNSKEKFEEMIKIAGGTSIAWKKNSVSKSDLDRKDVEYILMQFAGEDSSNKQLNELIRHQQKKGKRTISVHEIALAIVNCSCEKNCNPNFNRIAALVAKEETKVGAKALAMATQSQPQTSQVLTNDEIPDSQSDAGWSQSTVVIPNSGEPDVEMGKEVREGEHQKPTCNKRVSEWVDSASKRQKTDDIGIEAVKSPPVISKPSTSSLSKPSTSSLSKPSTSGLSKPSTSCLSKPSTSNLSKPSTSNSSMPSTSNSSKSNPFTVLNTVKNHPNPATKENNTSEKVNPFIAMRKRKSSEGEHNSNNKRPSQSPSKENPFVAPKPKKSKETAQNKPQLNHSQSNDVFSSTAVGILPSFNPNISTITVINTSKTDWISRSSKNTSNKENLSKDDTKVDKELIEYENSLKDTIVVEEFDVIADYMRRCGISSASTNNGTATTRNFKKFKKVRPLFMQSSIYPRSEMGRYVFNGEDIPADLSSEDDSDGDASEGLNFGRANAKKRKVFDF